jgi:hypothetical protein
MVKSAASSSVVVVSVSSGARVCRGDAHMLSTADVHCWAQAHNDRDSLM